MYLCDDDIRSRLDELRFEVDGEHPFDADEQIQPCSIDLRLSSLIWRPNKLGKFPVDLTSSTLRELNPRRNWKRTTVRTGETFILKPGELVLGRVHERFTVPPDCAGQIEGRSSFARMGLAVHCTGSFINPGWRGHMPLTLINHGPTKLKLPTHIAICQLMLIPLSRRPSKVYGTPSLRNKYMNDDGGPSFWWRDKTVKSLLDLLGPPGASDDLQQAILDRIGVPADEVLGRLEHYVASRPIGTYSNAEDLLSEFARLEDRRRMIETTLRGFGKGSLPVTASASLGSLLAQPIGGAHILLWILTALSVPLAIAAFMSGPKEYLGKRELAER